MARTYKKRYTKSRTPNRYKTDTRLILYNSPFTVGYSTPKIPDGKTTSSLGLRQQTVFDAETTAAPMNIFFYPGLFNGIFLDGYERTSNQGIKPYSSEGMKITLPFGNNAQVEKMAFSPPNDLDKWRIVSQALKIRLLNSMDDNEGWWEAVRYTLNPKDGAKWLSMSAKPFSGTDDVMKTIGTTHVAVPDAESVLKVTDNGMMQHPSYTTGRLKDIHHVVFQLKPTNGDHDFVATDNNIVLDTPTLQGYSFQPESITAVDANLQQVNAITPASAGGVSIPNDGFDDLIMSQIDTSYDAIRIVIHGRSALDSEQQTKVLMSLICNQEHVYHPSSTYAKFQTRSSNNKNLVDKRRSMLVSKVQSAHKSHVSYT
jgi:hypothetical protein